MSNNDDAKIPHEAIDFSISDFNQCFEQARYYDTQIVDIFKFLATYYTTVAGIAIGLYQYASEKNINIHEALICGLIIALIFGICMFFLIVRNRVYFVFCMRYINEHRKNFLSFKPLGFENKTKMYTNHKKPPFFNIFSSQSWWMYVVAILNSTLLGIIGYFIKLELTAIVGGGVILLMLQLLIGILYLKSQENKSASAAVFGK